MLFICSLTTEPDKKQSWDKSKPTTRLQTQLRYTCSNSTVYTQSPPVHTPPCLEVQHSLLGHKQSSLPAIFQMTHSTINMAQVHTCPTPTRTSTNNSRFHCIKWVWVKLKGGSIKPPPTESPGYGPENHNSPAARLIV